VLETRFELRLTPTGREQLTALAADLGVSAADVVRMSLRKMSAAHSRKTRRDAQAPAMPAALPAAPPSIATMSLPELLALRDELALQRTQQAERDYVEVNTEIIKREMRGAPR
jgi:hypothetical protein